MILLELFLAFLFIGCFSFGGAYVAIPLIRDVVLSYGWIDEEKLSYMIAVSESTPGPIMVNLATYIGSTKAGVLGAAISTFAVILPAFLIVIMLMLLFNKLIKSIVFQSILSSLKACVIGIILATGVYMIIKNCIGGFENISIDIIAIITTIVLGVIYFGLRKILKNSLPPIILICLAGLAGVLVYGW